uniref:SAM domain-containing protein n=1 Tax=Nothobranchius furzeri TaxID=105023 RepID=A0A8C6KJW2_NOTFU
FFKEVSGTESQRVKSAGEWLSQVETRLPHLETSAVHLSKRTSSWSVEEVLEWIQEQHPMHMNTLHKSIIKHDIAGRALLRLKEHHLELFGLEDEEQQQKVLQDLLLLKVQEEICELGDICSEGNPFPV